MKRHGDPGMYRYHGCRCDECRAAASEQTAQSRRRARAARPLAGPELAALPLPGEEWRAVVGQPDYEVSSLGRVRSLKSTNPRLLSLFPDRNGYLRARLWRGNKSRFRFVHGMVAAAFIGPCPRGQEVRHYDDDKSNNAVANLLYGTRSQNVRDAVRNGTQAQAAKTHCPQGHPYDAANTMVRPNGWRTCRTCQSERQKAARARRAS